ncbi:Protein of unknown function [Gryllus bimaculatus]|nr:Protein of unknown function [Gryllus bimaculatus]
MDGVSRSCHLETKNGLKVRVFCDLCEAARVSRFIAFRSSRSKSACHGPDIEIRELEEYDFARVPPGGSESRWRLLLRKAPLLCVARELRMECVLRCPSAAALAALAAARSASASPPPPARLAAAAAAAAAMLKGKKWLLRLSVCLNVLVVLLYVGPHLANRADLLEQLPSARAAALSAAQMGAPPPPPPPNAQPEVSAAPPL